MPDVRESRRIVGVKTRVADDLERGENARHFQTSLAIGDYYMDLHHTYEALEFDLDRSDFTQANGPFQIPFEVFRSEEQSSALSSLMRYSYAVCCMKQKQYTLNTSSTKTSK